MNFPPSQGYLLKYTDLTLSEALLHLRYSRKSFENANSHLGPFAEPLSNFATKLAKNDMQEMQSVGGSGGGHGSSSGGTKHHKNQAATAHAQPKSSTAKKGCTSGAYSSSSGGSSASSSSKKSSSSK